MEEDIPEPDSEKPRYLLPDGCKDLIDVLRRQQHLKDVEAMKGTAAAFGNSGLAHWLVSNLKLVPASVTLPDPVTVKELATVLNLQAFEVIATLMIYNVFASIEYRIDFETAVVLCSHYGVAARRSP